MQRFYNHFEMGMVGLDLVPALVESGIFVGGITTAILTWAFGWPLPDFSNPTVEKMRGWLSHNSWLPEDRVDLGTIKQFNRRAEMLNFAGGESLARCKAEGRERVRWWIKARRTQGAAKEAAGIEIRVLLHTLRHCFAAHLLKQMVYIRVIQKVSYNITGVSKAARETGRAALSSSMPRLARAWRSLPVSIQASRRTR